LGRLHGQGARDDIRFNVATVHRDIETDIARGRRYDYDTALDRNLGFLQRDAPDILEEIQGIADGAELPFRDILLLNVPLFIAAQFLPLDCTQMLFMPPATGDSRTYLAKTRDFNNGGFRQVVLHRRYPDGHEMVEVHTAGSVTWPGSGLNSHGVALSTSGVWSRRTTVDLDRIEQAWFLINSHLLLRGSSSVDDVWSRLQAHPRVTGLNIVVADRNTGAAFEATAEGAVRHDADDGVIVRSNHYMAPELNELSPWPDEHPSSYHRYATATSIARARHESWQENQMIGLLGDHDGYPQRSICRHSENGGGADTVYASIATLPDGTFWTILDHPCQASTREEARPETAASVAGK
jgi:isopenicillin-N N-acyltransferase-like protein